METESGRKGRREGEKRRGTSRRGFAVDRRSSPVASTTPLLPLKAFPLTRNDLSSLPRSENTDQGKGKKKSFLLKRRIQRAVGRISTLYNAMPWRTSLLPIFQMNDNA